MRLGVLDIGSNPVHLLLVDAHPGARPIPFTSHKRPLQLVQFLEDDGSISAAGQRKLVEFVGEVAHLAKEHGAEDMMAFATSAIREATNGPAVLRRSDRRHRATGHADARRRNIQVLPLARPHFGVRPPRERTLRAAT